MPNFNAHHLREPSTNLLKIFGNTNFFLFVDWHHLITPFLRVILTLAPLAPTKSSVHIFKLFCSKQLTAWIQNPSLEVARALNWPHNVSSLTNRNSFRHAYLHHQTWGELLPPSPVLWIFFFSESLSMAGSSFQNQTKWKSRIRADITSLLYVGMSSP